ncbi:28 kDa ribonucleoprotein, chloroplastic [Apium graveolens]|uniref:28 kDa ribonucleoprotein, chloroplastic n=1 Tax=Apium graveolens TaxID=4045 RepID=UPI003D78C2FF
MVALESSFTLFSTYPSSSSSKSTYPFSPKPSSSVKFHLSHYTPTFSLKTPLASSLNISRKSRFEVFTTVQEEIQVEEKDEGVQIAQKRKLFVLNLPWSLTVADIKKLFGECGIVTDIEIIKQKSGKSRGFAFVTMASAEEAQAVIDKFNSYEVSGRVITVEFAKRLKRPSPPTPDSPPPGESRYKLYVSNLAWKVRANNLREFFAANFKPVSARVVFNNPSGNSSGYGFVSFATREEAETAISELNGKELLGRPISLKFSEKSIDGSESTEQTPEGQPEES